MSESGSNFLIKALLNIIKKPGKENGDRCCRKSFADRPISCQVFYLDH